MCRPTVLFGRMVRGMPPVPGLTPEKAPVAVRARRFMTRAARDMADAAARKTPMRLRASRTGVRTLPWIRGRAAADMAPARGMRAAGCCGLMFRGSCMWMGRSRRTVRAVQTDTAARVRVVRCMETPCTYPARADSPRAAGRSWASTAAVMAAAGAWRCIM